jgi:anti-sigma regulatory factor (Ser/Thr protein kinase)
LETSVTFPGLPAIVPSARRFVRGILAGSPRADDMELITAELVSNAIRHTPSGRDGGEFTLTVHTEPGWARVEVSDAGTSEWTGPRDASDEEEEEEEEYGRGLAIVAALADKLGHDVRSSGQTVWAEVTW